MKTADKYIPLQTEGRQTDFTASVALKDMAEAHQRFISAKMKLLDVSNWHTYCGPGTSKFGLTDDKGILLHRLAQVGDFFYIDLPIAPGPDAGDGQEWVKIENITEHGDADSNEEYIVVTARPAPDPRKDTKEIANFFKEASTNTFMVARYGLKVSAEVHGRNETPNNENVDLFDAVRNTAIALSARIGLSGTQWQKLAKGLLEQ